MELWTRVAAAIDRFSIRLGSAISWLVVAMVLIGAFNAVARYLGRYLGVNLSSNFYLELQTYLFSLIFLLGASYALASNAHVRVDVLLSRLSRRPRAWIELLGTLFLLLPFCIVSILLAWPMVLSSWRVREGSPDPSGLPRYPLKALILVCFGLLVAQGAAEVIKALQQLRSSSVGASE